MIRRFRRAVFNYFGTYHEQRAKHFKALCETLELDVMAAAKSEGEALTKLREAHETIEGLRRDVMRYRNKLHNTLRGAAAGELRKLSAGYGDPAKLQATAAELTREVAVEPCGHVVAPGFVCILEPEHDGRHVAPTCGHVVAPGFVCILEPEHDGQHVAPTSSSRAEVWRQAEHETALLDELHEYAGTCGRVVPTHPQAVVMLRGDRRPMHCQRPPGHAGDCDASN